MFVTLLAGTGFAAKHPSRSTGSRPANMGAPRDLLQKYLDADFHGSRLDKDTKAPTVTAVTWTDEPQEDRLIVIQNFGLGKTKVRRKVAKVLVTYRNLGELKGLVYFPEGTTEEATFDIVRKNGRWLIDRPILMPHVSVDVAVKHLQQKLAALPADSAEAGMVKKSLAALQEQTRKVTGTTSKK